MQINNCYVEEVEDQVIPFSSQPQTDSGSQQKITYHNCTGCGLPILDSSFLLLDSNYWHSLCLKCNVCAVPLGGASTCFVKDDCIYCRQDYQRLFSPRWCQRCGLYVEPYELVMKVQGHIYHANPICFSCASCQRPLVTGEKYLLEERGLCCLTCAHYDKPIHTKKRKQNVTSPHIDSIGGMTANYVTQDPTTAAIERHQESVSYRQTQKIKRMRTSFKHHQLRAMKSYFTINHNPDAKDLKQLAQETGLTKRVLQVWFQNARAKYRRTSDQDPKCSTSEIKKENITRENEESSMLDSNSDSFTFSVDSSPDEIENLPYESSHGDEIIDTIPSPNHQKYQSFFGAVVSQSTTGISGYLHSGYIESMTPMSTSTSSALHSL